jgi:hypothetical protein
VLLASLGLLCLAPEHQAGAAARHRALDLSRIPWEGGSNYYARFPKARASGWDRPGFFPISVFLGSADPAIVAQYKDAGVNTVLGVEHDPADLPISNVTSRGLYAIVQLEPEDRAEDWTSAEVGANPGVVGWFATDECEMGYSGCTLHDATKAECNARYADPTNPANQEFFRLYRNRAECVAVARRNAASCSPLDHTQYQDRDECLELAYQRHLVHQLREKDDGRFVAANFGNGVARTFWSPNTMDTHYPLVDLSAADKYAYTSRSATEVLTGGGFNSGSKDWPADAAANRAGAYGFIADQFQRFADPSRRTPIGVAVETGKPLLDSADCWTAKCMITPGQLEGAVWSAIIHEARHIVYFDHSNGSRCGSIANCPVVHAAVKKVDHQIEALAPVLNTRSYYNRTPRINGTSFHRYVFPNVSRDGRRLGGPSNGTNAMLKTYRGSAYIFADIGLEITGTAPFDPDPNLCEEIDGTMACKAQGYNQAPGKKVFKLPRGVHGRRVRVVGEHRAIRVNRRSRTFTDRFATEHSHHIYRVRLSR